MSKTGKRLKLFWERAYKGHAYWGGKKKLGRVTLAERGRYSWQAAGRAGSADDLEKAKKAVEAAVAMADKQLDLFR
ncbi:MAG: hypothetical protein HYS35_02995 [Betaproteobacteria bacterium]|nr:hypothetical protein [Betaproteobacteria bacterium]